MFLVLVVGRVRGEDQRFRVCCAGRDVHAMHRALDMTCILHYPPFLLPLAHPFHPRPQLKRADLETLKEGESLFFGGKEIQISNEISNADYSTGKCFLGKW